MGSENIRGDQSYGGYPRKVPMKLSSGIVGEPPKEINAKELESKITLTNMLMKSYKNDVNGGVGYYNNQKRQSSPQ